jgi:hypothetical protein
VPGAGRPEYRLVPKNAGRFAAVKKLPGGLARHPLQAFFDILSPFAPARKPRINATSVGPRVVAVREPKNQPEPGRMSGVLQAIAMPTRVRT